MGAIRLTFVIIVLLGTLGATALRAPSVSAQESAPRAEPPQPKPEAQPRAEPKAEPKAEPRAEPRAEPKAPVPKAQPKRGPASPPLAERDDKTDPPPGCGWIGKRVIQSLLRDDAVTAQDFDQLYRTFNCPGEYLRLAFDCTVSDGAPSTANEAQMRLDACWHDPKFDTKSPKIQLPTSSGSTTAPGTSASQPKGASSGKAPAPAAAPPAPATPNYPKGK